MSVLTGKNILMIGVKFYHYNDEIINKLEKSGANVTFFYERDISIKHAIIDAFFNQYMRAWQEQHYAGILKEIAGKQFDYLLVIRGFMMPLDFVDRVKDLNPGIKTIMYQWDSLHNWDYREKIPLFDHSYTFDYKDAEQLGLKYVPTFHTDEFSHLEPVKIKYDLFFYGNFTQERYTKMQELIAFAQLHGYKLKTHLYIGYKRYLKENLEGAKLDKKYLSFRRMNKTEYVLLFNHSNIIVDLTTTTQSGLAMRVLDTLGAGKKLITNNVNIKNEPFYDPEQIFILQDDRIDVPGDFFSHKTFPKIDYSIENWVRNIFG